MDVRMQEHPILGAMGLSKKVKFQYNGTELEGYEGEPIAMALKAAGVMVHRYTQKEHQPRGIFCAIGRCTDCVMIVNGKPKCQNVCDTIGIWNAGTNTVWRIRRAIFQAAVSL